MLKALLKSLTKKKLSVFFIVSQISITIFLLFNVLNTFNVFTYQKNQISKLVGSKKDELLKVQFRDLYPSKKFADGVYELNKYANSLPEVDFSGGFIQTSYVFNELKNNYEYLDISRKLYQGTLRGEHLDISDSLLLDKKIDKIIDLKISEGRGFSESDFYLKPEVPVPVIVGSRFKSILNIGETLSAENSISPEKSKKFIIIGFLEQNSNWLSTGDYISNKIVNLDDKFIIPLYDGTQNNILATTSKASSYFIRAKDKAYIDSIKIKLNNKAKELGLNVEIYTVNESLEKYREENYGILKNTIIIICFLIVMSSFTMVSTILSSIERRKRELGIRVMAGASISYLKKLVMGEIFIITIFSTLISLAYIIYSKYKFSKFFLMTPFNILDVINIKSIATLIFSIFIFMLFVSYIPLRKIQKLQPKDLIGGIE